MHTKTKLKQIVWVDHICRHLYLNLSIYRWGFPKTKPDLKSKILKTKKNLPHFT